MWELYWRSVGEIQSRECNKVQAHEPAVYRHADISCPLSVCVCVYVFLLAAPTTGPVRAHYGTAYRAVRLSILSVARPPVRPTRSSNLAPSLERMPWTATGWHKDCCSLPVHLLSHFVSPVAQSHGPTPSTTQATLFSIQRHLYEYIWTSWNNR
jgi:hypothetical protein